MPQRCATLFEAGVKLQRPATYQPGYEWLPGRFGPAPGVAKAKKEELDWMNDEAYMQAINSQLSKAEKNSLMKSEAERRRTFAAGWPKEDLIGGKDCAKEGFFYTGVEDKVECAFCGYTVAGWSIGDVPFTVHSNGSPQCKLVKGEPCQNILANDDVMDTGPSKSHERLYTTGKLDRNIPCYPDLCDFMKRKETFSSYPSHATKRPLQLCEAGFFYTGTEDTVTCHWCDGSISCWEAKDDPWVEHARWFPGCLLVQNVKGLTFIREIRKLLNMDNKMTSDKLQYQQGDVYFMEGMKGETTDPTPIEKMAGYKYCLKMNYKEENIRKAYDANNYQEFDNPAYLLNIVMDLEQGKTTLLEEHLDKVAAKRLSLQQATKYLPMQREDRVSQLFRNRKNLTRQELNELITALRCKVCLTNKSMGLLVPCRCLCICAECIDTRLPSRCPACGTDVRGSVKLPVPKSQEQW